MKVSIILPVYNSGKYLDACINSILTQSLTDFELIIVDDGSSDGSSERCDYYGSIDKRVKVIHQKNSGICNSRNAAIKIASGEFVSFCDHDDEFAPNLLKNAYDKVTKEQADIIKFRKKEFIYKNDRLVRTKSDLFSSMIIENENISDYLFFLKNVGILNCVWDGLYKRTLFDKHLFDPYYKSGGEDIAFMYSIISDISKLVLLDEVLYFHYIRKGFSTSTKFKLDNIDSKERLCTQINNLLYKLDIKRDEHQFEYAYYLLKFVYCPVISIISNPSCPYTYRKKVHILKEMKSKEYTPHYFLLQSTFEVFKNSKKLGIAYLLLKTSSYKLLFAMFKARSKYA